MPPWKPLSGYGAFAGENLLTKSQIEILAAWAQGGAPRGRPEWTPEAPHFAAGWKLGTPDAVLSLSEPYIQPAGGPDRYRCFVVPKSFPGERWVRAFEFEPGGKVVHHSLIFVDSRRLPPASEPYDCFGTPGFLPSAALGGWTPGMSAVTMPPGTAIHVPAGARFVMQLHFHPTGKEEIVDPKIAVYFAAKAPDRVLMDVPLGSNEIDIPAGTTGYQVTDRFVIPVPLEVTGIIPHAHYLCKTMEAWAVLPDGKKRWLLSIADWDFNWQEQYRYERPFVLPADTEIHMRFIYDNSDENIRNPNHPAKRVTWGTGSSDEMAGLHLQVIPRNEADMHKLGMALWGKVMRGVGGSFYRSPTPIN